MAPYERHEYADMVFLYAQCNNNALGASRRYAELYPQRRHPSAPVIREAVRRFRESGNVMSDHHNAGRPQVVRNADFEDEVLEAFHNNPRTSTRVVARQMGTSHVTVWKILKEDNQHPYHLTRVQGLHPGDEPRRLRYCTWLLRQHHRNPFFIQRVLFTDESKFGRCSSFNQRNAHEWGSKNNRPYPRRCDRQQQQLFSINVWLGVIGDHVVGPYFFDGILNGQRYNNFLIRVLPRLLNEAGVLPAVRRVMWFQQDGAPPHRTIPNLRAIKRRVGNRYIGPNAQPPRFDPPAVAWPARSPDLTPLDYFVWGFIKDFVYQVEIATLEILQERINQAIGMITPEMLQNSRQNMIRRLQCCIEQNGGHFEHLLIN